MWQDEHNLCRAPYYVVLVGQGFGWAGPLLRVARQGLSMLSTVARDEGESIEHL